ncbi:hypothetical protein HPB47_020937 [Ixodes persulcatus]|uniref:Uncharacterized protein n=1 Tax=Ixodes persulcatus TaxID=34615 RepID=A0AC60QE48_IXOPE|nr:hypothetical protein HPB47_020937 [Ixodes persulcatus]
MPEGIRDRVDHDTSTDRTAERPPQGPRERTPLANGTGRPAAAEGDRERRKRVRGGGKGPGACAGGRQERSRRATHRQLATVPPIPDGWKEQKGQPRKGPKWESNEEPAAGTCA